MPHKASLGPSLLPPGPTHLSQAGQIRLENYTLFQQLHFLPNRLECCVHTPSSPSTSCTPRMKNSPGVPGTTGVHRRQKLGKSLANCSEPVTPTELCDRRICASTLNVNLNVYKGSSQVKVRRAPHGASVPWGEWKSSLCPATRSTSLEVILS